MGYLYSTLTKAVSIKSFFSPTAFSRSLRHNRGIFYQPYFHFATILKFVVGKILLQRLKRAIRAVCEMLQLSLIT